MDLDSYTKHDNLVNQINFDQTEITGSNLGYFRFKGLGLKCKLMHSGNTSSDSSFKCITYGNRKFMIVGQNIIRTSEDGNKWINGNGYSFQYNSITFGNNLFVAVGNAVCAIATSNGAKIGLTSVTENKPFNDVARSGEWCSVTYGNNLFVAVGLNKVMYTQDPNVWTSVTTNPEGAWKSITYGNNLFVVVGTNCVMSSVNGTEWTILTNIPSGNWLNVTYGNGTYVAVGNNCMMSSTNGTSWTKNTDTNIDKYKLNNVTFGNGIFIAISSRESDSKPCCLLTSYDGISWIFFDIPYSTNQFNSIIFANGMFIALSNNSHYSTNGYQPYYPSDMMMITIDNVTSIDQPQLIKDPTTDIYSLELQTLIIAYTSRIRYSDNSFNFVSNSTSKDTQYICTQVTPSESFLTVSFEILNSSMSQDYDDSVQIGICEFLGSAPRKARFITNPYSSTCESGYITKYNQYNDSWKKYTLGFNLSKDVPYLLYVKFNSSTTGSSTPEQILSIKNVEYSISASLGESLYNDTYDVYGTGTYGELLMNSYYYSPIGEKSSSLSLSSPANPTTYFDSIEYIRDTNGSSLPDNIFMPWITLTPPSGLVDFINTAKGSNEKSFSISGRNLVDSIHITSESGNFLFADSSGIFNYDLNIEQTNGSVGETFFNVKLIKLL